MKTHLTPVPALIAAFLFAGCDAQESDAARDSERETVGSQVADDYNRQMDRARDVEIQLQDKMERVEDALREADSQAAPEP